jgi:hypothetical protein
MKLQAGNEVAEVVARINYVLIDYENVQPESLAQLERPEFRVIVFVGANQTRIPFEVAASLQRMGRHAEYVKISGNGPNAADFHIAYYIGRLAEADPRGFFHVISKDTGFDPLVKHLKASKIFSCRSSSIARMPCFAPAKPPEEDGRLQLAMERLAKMTRPVKVKTLETTLDSMFQKKLDSADLAQLIKALVQTGCVKISGTSVSYAFPKA